MNNAQIAKKVFIPTSLDQLADNASGDRYNPNMSFGLGLTQNEYEYLTYNFAYTAVSIGSKHITFECDDCCTKSTVKRIELIKFGLVANFGLISRDENGKDSFFAKATLSPNTINFNSIETRTERKRWKPHCYDIAFTYEIVINYNYNYIDIIVKYDVNGVNTEFKVITIKIID